MEEEKLKKLIRQEGRLIQLTLTKHLGRKPTEKDYKKIYKHFITETLYTIRYSSTPILTLTLTEDLELKIVE